MACSAMTRTTLSHPQGRCRNVQDKPTILHFFLRCGGGTCGADPQSHTRIRRIFPADVFPVALPVRAQEFHGHANRPSTRPEGVPSSPPPAQQIADQQTPHRQQSFGVPLRRRAEGPTRARTKEGATKQREPARPRRAAGREQQPRTDEQPGERPEAPERQEPHQEQQQEHRRQGARRL